MEGVERWRDGGDKEMEREIDGGKKKTEGRGRGKRGVCGAGSESEKEGEKRAAGGASCPDRGSECKP
eukprot:2278815-Pleurochrysis_carterae.AAC.1